MTLEKIKDYLEKYKTEDGIALIGYYDFVIRDDKLYAHLIDGGEDANSRFYRVGLFFVITIDKDFLYYVEDRHQSRPKTKGKSVLVRSREEIAFILTDHLE